MLGLLGLSRRQLTGRESGVNLLCLGIRQPRVRPPTPRRPMRIGLTGRRISALVILLPQLFEGGSDLLCFTYRGLLGMATQWNQHCQRVVFQGALPPNRF
jgi:hypothetical protein